MSKNVIARKTAARDVRPRNLEKLAFSEPRALKVIGEESVRNGTNLLSSKEIQHIIQLARAERRKRIS
jgi:hypothetical protein